MQTKSNLSRKEILAKIAAAKQVRKDFSALVPDWDTDIYKEIDTSLEECFAQELAAVNGNAVLCSSESEAFAKIKMLLAEKNISRFFCRTTEIAEKLQQNEIAFSSEPQEFLPMEAGITFCEALVARTGTVVVSAAHEAGRQMNVFPPIHIVLARKEQIVPYLSDALVFMKKKYGNNLPSAITNITGPSRTADIEKTLILGAHGPKEIYVLIF
ncbi:MAG: lactate utilization protein [Prevotellaceae bacterium]|jgi:L-lactate dehydrogenase complex protein LldG|nr:lactate utilization protein [Prevotellaceae bacterium]